MANLRAYRQMVEVARKQKLPESYETDLYCIDRALLEEDAAPAQFGWILYNCGTHIIYDQDTAHGTKAYYESPCNRNLRDAACFYWFDGSRLRSVLPWQLWEHCLTLQPKWGPPTASFHNRNEQLHIQEAARAGKPRTQLTFAITLPGGELEYTHYNFRYMRGVDYDLEEVTA